MSPTPPSPLPQPAAVARTKDEICLDALKAEDNFSGTIFVHADAGFLQWQPLNDGFRFSPSVAHLLGYPPGRLPLNAAVIRAHIYCDDYPTVKLFFANRLLSGEGGVIKFRMVKEDTTVSWFQLQMKVLDRDHRDQIACAVATVCNIDHVAASLNEIKSRADDEQWLRLTIRELLQRQDDNALDDCLRQFCNRVGVDHAVLRQAYRDGERYRLIAKGRHQRIAGDLDFSRIILRKHMPYEFARAERGAPALIDDISQVASLSPLFQQRAKDLNIRSIATLPIYYHGNIDYYLSLITTGKTQPWQDATVRLGEALGDALAQVAARRRITQSLEVREERFQNALEATQDGVWDWDVDKHSFYVTPSFLYMLGYDEEVLPLNRKKIASLLCPPASLNDFFADPGTGKGLTDQVVQFRHRRGHTVWIWVRAKHLAWDKSGKATRAIGVNVDITRFQAGTEKPGAEASRSSPAKASGSNGSSAPTTPDEALRTAKILLAEDNPINQQVANGILKRKGVQVTIVNNGREAVDLLQSSPPHSFDLVLMDMEMPVLDGYAATRLLRGNQQFKDLPIIALTAHARDEDRKNCLSLGMNDHVAKPVKPEILYAAISKQLGPKSPSVSHKKPSD